MIADRGLRSATSPSMPGIATASTSRRTMKSMNAFMTADLSAGYMCVGVAGRPRPELLSCVADQQRSMSTLLWVLVGVLGYSLAAVALDRRGFLPDSVKISGPLMTVHTRRGRAVLNQLARPKRSWRALANVGVGIALVTMVGTFLLLILQSITILQSPPTETVLQNPRNALVIPGVNEFLPLSVAPEIIIGLLVGLVVHEGGHGLLCRVEDIDIDSMGVVLFALLPIGAFVEPDEESANAASRGARTRMFAAGVLNNLIITALVFALLFGPVGSAIAVAPGAGVGGVFSGSAADFAEIETGDRIVAVDGESIESNSDLSST